MSSKTANPYRISLTEMLKQEGRTFEAMAEEVMFGDPPTKQAPLTPAEPTAAETLATMAQDLKAQTQSRRRTHRVSMTSASPRTMNCTK
jgi:hypothetical protein